MSSKDQAAPKAMPIATPSRVISALEPSDTQSANLLEGNLAQLKTLFPEAFKEGGVDFEVLKQLLGGQVDEREEKYGLNWHGKRRARQIALTPSTGTLRPCPGESVDWDTTQNLMIEGDNLEVLKLLQKSYAGKVKMIYIDPPYNTGKDFVYPDNFTDNIKNYLELTGQTDGEGRKLSSNTEASGRFHTDWLNMMYPRLKLARNLLREDGAIFVSLDDKETPHLRVIMDSIFGGENYLGTFVWEGGRKNDARRISIGHDYFIVYARSETYLQEKDIRWKERKAGLDSIYSKVRSLQASCGGDFETASKDLQTWYKNLPDGSQEKEHAHYKQVDSGGVFFGDNISSPNFRANLVFDWKGYKPPSNGWRYDKASMERLDLSGLLIYPDSKDARIQYKRYLHQTEFWSPSSVFYKDRRAASKSLIALMGSEVFDFPKDCDVIGRFIETVCADNDLVMDFFAGSGSTAQAVYELNARRAVNHRYILVQLPEALELSNKDQNSAAEFCDSIGKPRNIAELTKERLRRSATKIGAACLNNTKATAQLSLENETKMPAKPLDLGFKVFKLDTSNIRAWNPNPDELADTLMAHTEHLAAGRTEADVLYEVLLKQGLDLAIPVQRQVIAEHTVHSVGAGALLVCLARDGDEKGAMSESSVTAANAEALALGIADWHTQLAAALGQTPAELHTRVVLRDSLFDGDVAKTNLTAILRQRGLEDVRSL